MTTWQPVDLGRVDEGAVTYQQYRERVQAVGVALLFAYGVLKS